MGLTSDQIEDHCPQRALKLSPIYVAFYLSIAISISMIWMPDAPALPPGLTFSFRSIGLLVLVFGGSLIFSFLILLLPSAAACAAFLWPILLVHRVRWLKSRALWYVYSALLGAAAGLISMRFILPALELVDSEASQHTPVTLNPVALSIYFVLFCLAGLASAGHILKIAGISGRKNL